MKEGREICDVLKAIRKRIADANGIPYEPDECHYTGVCPGTCPKCQAELAMLESVIDEKQINGETVNVSGIASDLVHNYYLSERVDDINGKEGLFHVYLLIDSSKEEDTVIFNSLISQLLECVRDVVSNDQGTHVMVECYDFSKKKGWEIINLEDSKHLFLQSGGAPNLKMGFYELGCKLSQTETYDYVPLLVLMSNGVSVGNPHYELKRLSNIQLFREGIKIAFMSSSTPKDIEFLKDFTGSMEAVFMPENGTVLRQIVRLIPMEYDILSGDIEPLEGNVPCPHIYEGLPIIDPNDDNGNDEWG